MPNWKKLIVSGSDAILRTITATAGATISGSLNISGSINNPNYIDFNTQYTSSNWPAHKEGRLFYDSSSAALVFYNWEQDVALNIGQESWLRARNNTGTLITNGSVVKLTGAVGDRPSIGLAQSTDQTNTFSTSNEIIGMATHDIENGTDGFVTTFGLVNGLDTSAYNAGDILWVSQSAGQFTKTPPSVPYDKTFVGIVARANPSNGAVFVTPLTPIHFHDISSVSASAYTMGDLWMYRSGSAGQANAWINTKSLTGAYTISGSLILTGSLSANSISASSITGSLQGTASWASNALSASATPNALITASVSTNVITFTKGNGTTFNLTVNTGSGGGSTTPGGSDTYIQFNSASAFNGSAAFRYIYSSQSFQHGYGTTAAVGGYSHAEGENTTALGALSHAEGYNTTATGIYTHTEGVSTNAIGAYSHAEGQNTYAYGQSSHAEGLSAISVGQASHAEGKSTLASASYSHAEGTNTVVYPTPVIDVTTITNVDFDFGSYAVISCDGTDIIISGDITGDIPSIPYTITSLTLYDVANPGGLVVNFAYYGSIDIPNAVYNVGTNETTLTLSGLSPTYQNVEVGASPTANGYGSHVEGYATTANGVASHAEGYATTAVGNFSHAEGFSTLASGSYSHAEGNSTIASGAYSHAEGSITIAYGVGSRATGINSNTYGDYSYAGGIYATTIGDYSFAHGDNVTAYGGNSFVHGAGTIASGSNQAVFGKFNTRNNTTDLFVIGNGTTNVNRQDIFNVSTTTITMSGSVNISGSLLVNGSAPGGGTPLATLVQSTPSNTWTFTHGLGVSNPIVTVYDSSNKVIIPQEVSASNSNTLVITFPTTVAGTAVAAGGTFVGATPQNAVTASYVLNAVSASYVLNAISSSYAATASYVLNAISSSYSTFALSANTATSATTAATASSVGTLNQDVNLNGDLIFTSPSSPGFNGEVVKFGAGTLTTGQLYFLSSSGTWSLADASSVSSSIGMLGIAMGSSPTSNGLLIRGYAASSSYTQSTGSILYVNTTAGGITETAPSTTNQVVRVVGYKTTISNTIYFMPDATWVTLA